MSALRSLIARRSPLAAYQLSAPRAAAFHSSRVLGAGKETALHKDKDARAQEVEAEKEDSLKKQQKGEGHWKDSLASDSESIVKADRGEVEASQETIKKLQEEAKKVAGK